MKCNQAGTSRKVSLSSLTLNFSLPRDFGAGWQYTSAWDSQAGNFALDVVHRLKGLAETEFHLGEGCVASFRVQALDEAREFEKALQNIVDAFQPRPARWITIAGQNYWDARVTERVQGADGYMVQDMPFRAYLVQHVPLAAEHPAIDGEPAERVLAEYGISPKPNK
ncbi:hypothetical protein [Paraburkholderia sp. J8-2]|uniref:hypothetical protein n=1 Tax=Paraburkholderia sp. J8-2 TaxID=2805440 RepID=UPI002AB5F7C6|nr:hypothetical protein [Paraburkholderia sp. J8-2]